MEDIEIKARNTGDLYVLARHVGDRTDRIVPWTGRNWRKWGREMVKRAVEHPSEAMIPDDMLFRAAELMEDEQKIIERARRWLDKAIAALDSGYPVPPRRYDSWERVLRILHTRGYEGATGAEIQFLTRLGHGPVSSPLSIWQQTGLVERLHVDRPKKGAKSDER